MRLKFTARGGDDGGRDGMSNEGGMAGREKVRLGGMCVGGADCMRAAADAAGCNK